MHGTLTLTHLHTEELAGIAVHNTLTLTHIHTEQLAYIADASVRQKSREANASVLQKFSIERLRFKYNVSILAPDPPRRA